MSRVTNTEAIDFLKTQKKLNQRNIKTLNSLNFETKDLKQWDNIYTYVIKLLKLQGGVKVGE